MQPVLSSFVLLCINVVGLSFCWLRHKEIVEANKRVCIKGETALTGKNYLFVMLLNSIRKQAACERRKLCIVTKNNQEPMLPDTQQIYGEIWCLTQQRL